MNLEEKNLRDKLKVEPVIEKDSNQYIFFTSEKAIKYTQEVLLAFGQELERMFPKMGFLLKARVKSEDSYKEKIEKKKKIYDTIGFCLVIETVSDNIVEYLDKKEDAGIIEEIEGAIAKRKKKELDKIDKEKQLTNDINIWKDKLSQLEKILKTDFKSKKSKEILEVQKELYTDMIKKLEIDKAQILAGYDEFIEGRKEVVRQILAKYILNRVLENPRMKKELGISKIPGRSKQHKGGKTGYYHASHESVVSSKLEGWVAEMQSLSLGDYDESRRGLSAHWRCDGKERNFPIPPDTLQKSKEQKEQYKKEVLEKTPKNMVYQMSSKNLDGTTTPGQIVVFSEVADITYHFWKVLKNRPSLLKFIQDEDELFSDKSEIIVDIEGR